VPGLGFVGRPAPALRGSCRTTPPRADPSQTAGLPPKSGPVRALRVRSLRLAAQAGWGALPLARSSSPQVPNARRHPPLAAASEAEVVDAVKTQAWRMSVGSRGLDAQLFCDRFLKAMRPLGATNASSK
jgi:hypothetical protein